MTAQARTTLIESERRSIARWQIESSLMHRIERPIVDAKIAAAEVRLAKWLATEPTE